MLVARAGRTPATGRPTVGAALTVVFLVAGLAACGGASRPSSSPVRSSRRRPEAEAEALGQLRSFCSHGGALVISADPGRGPIQLLLSRVDAAEELVGPGHNLGWMASDLAGAERQATAGHPRRERDDLYAALGAESGSPIASCVALGSAPP